jgi:hypothetical protein
MALTFISDRFKIGAIADIIFAAKIPGVIQMDIKKVANPCLLVFCLLASLCRNRR